MSIDPTLSLKRARELATRTVELSSAEQTEVLASVSDSALTRFADNRIHQNVAEHDAEVSIRAIVGTRIGVASTNRTDDNSLQACCDSALEAAHSAPEDPDFPGLPDSSPIQDVNRVATGTVDFDAQARATAVRSIVDQSASRELLCAGGVKSTVQSIAVANSRGIDVAQATSGIRATVLSMGKTGGSGWASFVSKDAGDLAAAALGDEAATLAERSENPGNLEPGEYTVVLAPEAVADLLQFLAWLGMGARAVEEGRSFMADHFDEKLLHESISITEDALSEHGFGLTFDFEGVPKQRVPIIDSGFARAIVTDSHWAARMKRPNTGHALPAPNSYGPLPLNLEMAPGDATVDELISAVDRGVYVTRFHYVNVEDPIPVTLTGMTRDGTFMIEDGRLTRPLKNLRFTQSVVEALGDVRGVTRDRMWMGSETNPVLVPGLLLGRFAFTGQTS